MTKTFSRVFRVQVLLILLSNLLFSFIFSGFVYRLYKQSLTAATDQAADNLIYLAKKSEKAAGYLTGDHDSDFEMNRFFSQIQTILVYDSRGGLLACLGDDSLDRNGFPRRFFDSSIRTFRDGGNGELLTLELFPVLTPGGGDRDPGFWIWANVKRSALILPAQMLFALLVAFVLSRNISRDGIRLSMSLLRLADGHWEEKIPDGKIDENRKIAEAVRILQSRLIRQRKMIMRRLQELTHDLKSPISGVYTQIEAVELGSLPLTEERFSRIYGELKYLNGLVDDMTEFYKLEDDALPLTVKTVSSEQFLDALKGRFEAPALKAGKTLTFRSEIPAFNGDAELLSRGVGNLLGNAVKHGKGASISLVLRSDGERILIEVENEGKIPEQDLAHIMSRYWSHGRNGSGLGLSITELIAKKHRGTLTVRNTDRDSVLFTIDLPL